MQNPLPRRGYWPLAAVILLVGGVFWILIPHHLLSDHWRACLLAFMCGLLVGVAEIVSRYRDEPLQACFSPFGLIYAVVNGALSLAALMLIFKYPVGSFKGVAGDGLLAAMTAGFGAAAVMRAKVAVIKGADDKDISIGPDFVIRILLRTVDKNVDRFRAERRQAVVVRSLAEIRRLGSFRMASEYLLASLLAFQNLDDDLKQQLRTAFDEYEKKVLPEDLKYLAMGFVFLTLVGEAHFDAVLKNAVEVRLPAATPPASAGAPPPPP
jgi:hypothetical protein